MQKVVPTLLSVALAICVLSATRSNAQDGRPSPGAVFVMTNAADRNEVISFGRAARASKADNRPSGFVDSESAKRSTMITVLVRELGVLWQKMNEN
jgi:hypothetical protein